MRLTLSKARKAPPTDILTLTCSPNGAYIATGSADQLIRILHANTGRQVGRALAGHCHGVHAVAYSPDGLRLVSGSDDGTLLVWDMHTQETVIGPLDGHTGPVRAVQYSPDGALIASGADDGLLKFWDARTGNCVATLSHSEAVESISFSPLNSRTIAVACGDRLARIYDADQLELVGVLAGHRSRVRCVQYSPDGLLIASASDDQTIRLWNSWTGDPITGPLRGHRNCVSSISFSYDGQKLVSASEDESVRVWDVASGQCLLGPLYGHMEPVIAISCSLDKHRFASSGHNSLRIWNINDGTSALPLVNPAASEVAQKYLLKVYAQIKAIAWFSNGECFATAGGDHIVRIWDARTGQESAKPFVRHDGPVNSVDVSWGSELLASGADDALVCVWHLVAQDVTLDPLRGHCGPVYAVKFLPDGKRLVSAGKDQTIRVWNVQSGASLHVIKAHGDSIQTLCVSHDGSQLASGSLDRTIRIWDLRSYEALGEPLKHQHGVSSAYFSANGSTLLSGCGDKIYQWDTLLGKKVVGFKHGGDVKCAQLSEDATRILSASADMSICIWDAGTRKPIQGWSHDHPVAAVAFSSDGERVVTGSNDGDLRMWDVISGNLLLPKQVVDTKHSTQASYLGLMSRISLNTMTQAFRWLLGSNIDNGLGAKGHYLSSLKTMAIAESAAKPIDGRLKELESSAAELQGGFNGRERREESQTQTYRILTVPHETSHRPPSLSFPRDKPVNPLNATQDSETYVNRQHTATGRGYN